MKDFIGIDQYGQTYHGLGTYPRKALLTRLRKSHASRMYIDRKDGSILHIGYVIGNLWITLYLIERLEKQLEGGGGT